MAILGFLAHAFAAEAADVEKRLATVPGLTTYGIHKENYIVAVADCPSAEMEALMERAKLLEGVITIYVTSFSMEDELEEMDKA